MADRLSSVSEKKTGLQVVVTGVIRLVMDSANITPAEVAVWSTVIAKVCAEKDYMMHNVIGLACGLQDILVNPNNEVGPQAYENNIKASVLFRESNEVSAYNLILLVVRLLTLNLAR